MSGNDLTQGDKTPSTVQDAASEMAAARSLISRRAFVKGAGAVTLAALLNRTELLGAQSAPVVTKRIYLAPDDHTDYFWSGNEATYQQAFLTMLDYYLDRADATASNPADFQSRWNCDGSFWVWVYERNRSASQFQRLINRIKDGHISFPLNALVVCLGGAPAEAVLRGMYYAGSLERRYNFRVPLAVAMENQTLPLGLVTLWAGSGAKYSWKGICDCDTLVGNAGDRQHEIYYHTGLDGSQVLLKWNSLLTGDNQAMGGYAEARNPSAIVDYVDTNVTFKSRYPYDVIGAFGQGWDDLQTTDQSFVQAAQAKSSASRRVIVSNQIDFFDDFAATYGATLPEVTSSFGNEWDLYCAALAEVSASVKRSVEKLRSAEALAVLVSLKNLAFMNDRQTARDQAWMNLGLYWEHNFGMVNPQVPGNLQPRITWQRRLANEIKSYVDTLHSDAVAALGGLIQVEGDNPRFYVFNPLNWNRTDAADFRYSTANPVHVVDVTSGQEVPSQLVTLSGQSYLRILASDIPSLGYKVFEIRSGAGSADFSAGAPTISNGNTLESSQYSIVLGSNGAITSLLDKSRSNREFARNFSGKRINDLGAASGALTTESGGVVSATLVATVNTSSPLRHVTRVTLFRDLRRIEIHNTITQNFDSVQTWHFGFNVDAPDVRHEEVGAILRARLTTNGGHYSARAANSRYDWLTLNHFADMTGTGEVGVTLSNADCYFMKLGNSTVGALDTQTSKIEVLAGGRVANGSNGLPSQGGDTSFLQRFALQTHGAYDQIGAMKFALEHQNPLVTGAVTGGTAYPATVFSFLSISNPNVLLWALKPADGGIGQGVVARVWNASDAAASFELTLPQDAIMRADELTHIETPLQNIAVTNGAFAANLTKQQLKTYAFQTASFWDVFDNHIFLPIVLKD